jgi:hypothetical protein
METGLHDLADDALKIIFAGRNIMYFRSVSKQIKKRIECIADIILMISSEGALCATSDFFAAFKGNVTVGSNHGWDAHIGWFDALIKATKAGLNIDTILPLSVDSRSIKALIDRLSSIPQSTGTKLRKLCISYAGSTRCFERSRPDIASLNAFSEHVVVGLQLSYHRLGGFAYTAALLDEYVTRSSLRELTIRLNPVRHMMSRQHIFTLLSADQYLL